MSSAPATAAAQSSADETSRTLHSLDGIQPSAIASICAEAPPRPVGPLQWLFCLMNG
jgi:hypothetical protein